MGSACGVSEVAVDADPSGVWRSAPGGAVETTLDLDPSGGLERVTAIPASEACGVELGSWSTTGDRLTLDFETGPSEQYGFSRSGAGLELSGAGGAEAYTPLGRMISCVDYGWGEWSGQVTASIDGEPRSFADFEVELDVDAGRLRMRALWRPCPSCPPETPELELEIDAAPDPLEPGTFTVQNMPGAQRTFFAFFHPDPGNPDFEGFSTERLSPPGEFALGSIADDRIVATFSFRGNPRVDGDVAPDGSTTTLVTDGVVDLTYR